MLIVALALVFLGPEKLPDVARQVGKFVGQIRRTTDELKRTLNAEIRDEERDRRLTEYRERQAKARLEREAALEGTGEAEGELPGPAPEPADAADLGPVPAEEAANTAPTDPASTEEPS